VTTHHNKVRELYKEIAEDFNESIRTGDKASTKQSYRRNTVRNFFTLVETQLYLMKSEMLEVIGLPDFNFHYMPTEGERYYLSEIKYNIDDNGIISDSTVKIPFKKNFLFTFKIWWKIFNNKDDIKEDKKGYDSFWKAHDIRNRVTHPKVKDDFLISDDELGVIEEAHIWILKIVSY